MVTNCIHLHIVSAKCTTLGLSSFIRLETDTIFSSDNMYRRCITVRFNHLKYYVIISEVHKDVLS